MIKLTNVYLIGLLTAGLLVGCGGGGDNDNEANEGTEQSEGVEGNEGTETNHPVEADNGTGAGTATPPPMTSAPTFSSNVMAVLNAKCETCHGSNGNFTITTATMTYQNIMGLPGGAQYMLNKGNGDIGHGGNDALMDNEYATIKAWIDAGAMNN